MISFMKGSNSPNGILNTIDIYMLFFLIMTGTLSDVIQNDKYRIDDNIKFSLSMDIGAGMSFLHSQGIVHGKHTVYK